MNSMQGRTTGKIIEKEFGIEINKRQSGPLGDDQHFGLKLQAARLIS